MDGERVTIEGDFPLEGFFCKGSKGVCTIAHPHPLYGGDMNNNVVLAIWEGFRRLRFSVLRFNFRGVGKSGGEYSGGDGELRDLEAALRFSFENSGSCDTVVIAGYSFGAYIASLLAGSLENFSWDLFLVSYPVSMYDYSHLKGVGGRKFLISGERDFIAPKEGMLRLYELLSPPKKLEFFPTDHFFLGMEGEIERFILDNWA